MQHFAGDEWLNDEAINTYMAVVQARATFARCKEGFHAKTVALYVQCSTKILKQEWNYPLEWLAPVRIAPLCLSLFRAATILLPVALGFHWGLICVKPAEGTITWYDSFNEAKHRYLAVRVHEFLKVYKAMHGEPGDWDDIDSWTVTCIKGPEQPDGCACGVFVLVAAAVLERGLRLDWPKCEQYFKSVGKMRGYLATEVLHLFTDFLPAIREEFGDLLPPALQPPIHPSLPTARLHLRTGNSDNADAIDLVDSDAEDWRPPGWDAATHAERVKAKKNAGGWKEVIYSKAVPWTWPDGHPRAPPQQQPPQPPPQSLAQQQLAAAAQLPQPLPQHGPLAPPVSPAIPLPQQPPQAASAAALEERRERAFGVRFVMEGEGWLRVHGREGDMKVEAAQLVKAFDALRAAGHTNAAVRAAMGLVQEADGVREQVEMAKMEAAVKSSTIAARTAFTILKTAAADAVTAAARTSAYLNQPGPWTCSSIMLNTGKGQVLHSDTGQPSAVVNLTKAQPLLVKPDTSEPTWEECVDWLTASATRNGTAWSMDTLLRKWAPSLGNKAAAAAAALETAKTFLPKLVRAMRRSLAEAQLPGEGAVPAGTVTAIAPWVEHAGPEGNPEPEEPRFSGFCTQVVARPGIPLAVPEGRSPARKKGKTSAEVEKAPVRYHHDFTGTAWNACMYTGDHERLLEVLVEYRAYKPWLYVCSDEEPDGTALQAALEAYATGALGRAALMPLWEKVFTWGEPLPLPNTG